MKIKQFRTIMLCALSLLASCTQTRKGGEPVNYPETKKCDTVDTYFGVEVADPYRWLEDDYSEETAAWVESQNRLTQSYLSQIPYREKMKQHLKEMLDYPK